MKRGKRNPPKNRERCPAPDRKSVLGPEIYQRVIEATPNALVMADKQGTIVLVNAQTEKLFGYRREELIGSKVERLVPTRFQGVHPGHRDSFMNSPQPRAMGAGRDLYGLRIDGSEFPIEIGLNPIRTEKGFFVLAAIIDITERKRAEERQALLIKKLEEVNGELKDFAYVVAHDLKAPLRGIDSLANWLSTDYADKLDKNAQEQLDLLVGRVKRMDSLIDGILDYSRVGRAGEKKAKIDLNELVADVIDSMAVPENIEIKLENKLPCIVAEKIQMEQVFQNLLSNAVKFMDKPEGRIQIGCVVKDGCWEFRVSDNGPGIDKKHFEKIFQIFQTLTHRGELESTGIGLAIVKKIIERAGGQVWVKSKVGTGSVFFFNWPKSGG